MSRIAHVPFSDAFIDITRRYNRIGTRDLAPTGAVRVIDQSGDAAPKYTDFVAGVDAGPVVIFGDHTRAVKFADEPFVLGADGTKVLKPAPVLDPRFAYHWLAAQRIESLGYSRHFKLLKGLEVPVPEIVEQRRIADILDRAERLIQKNEAAQSSMQELPSSLYASMFRRRPLEDSPWPVRTLAEISAGPDGIKCGPFGTQLAKSEFTDAGVPLWGIRQIGTNFSQLPPEFLTPDKALALATYSIEPGDIVMTRKGDVGKCRVFPTTSVPGILHSDVLRIRLQPDISPTFVMQQLHDDPQVRHQIALVSGGAIMAGINVTKLKGIHVTVPPSALQSEFEIAVQAVTARVHMMTERGHLLRKSHAALSDRAFKGEL